MAGWRGGVAVIMWWLFFSRAPWLERLGAIVLMAGALLATSRIVHESIANGMMGFMWFIYAVLVLSLALVAWAAASRRFSNGLRRTSLVVTILLACGTLALIRTSGLTGDGDSDLEWRWTKSPEERLLAQASDEPVVVPSASAAGMRSERGPVQASDRPMASPTRAPAVGTPAGKRAPDRGQEPADVAPASSAVRTDDHWPGFRGAERDSIIRGVRIETDWSRSPPVEMWRRPVGPGWSSFAVRGDRLYTQEQRGDDEVVSAYNLNTGAPVWMHHDAARFWESNLDRVYTLGATGILNVLDARDGSVVWSRNAASDTSVKVPSWGIASSPLVAGDVVIAAAAGSLVAYAPPPGTRAGSAQRAAGATVRRTW